MSEADQVQEEAGPARNGIEYSIRREDDLIKGVGGQQTLPSNAVQAEDEYQAYYIGAGRTINAIEPPYQPRQLWLQTQENNALEPCIDAMVTNVDGTGFRIVKDGPQDSLEDSENSDPVAEKAMEFFKQPWPGESFQTHRKKLRRDMHSTGNAYYEVIRNVRDEILFGRPMDAKMTRMLKLDPPVMSTVTVKRGGSMVSLTMPLRWRRFVQIINGNQLTYFKEFGCPLDLDKHTGKWAKKGERVPAQNRATEVLHFIDKPDSGTPYGVPRWISQTPSVVGSRQAEEYNVEFFRNGGVPPVVVILQGGILGVESKKALQQQFTGRANKKQRIQVIEMEPIGGTVDHPGQAKVIVERFGAERQQDSMFEKYDDKCEIRVRRAFRLPPLFVGQAGDYSFATAFASYTVAEAQVFRPEREEFDEIISNKLLPALGFDGYKMVSNPLNIEDAAVKLSGIQIAMDTEQVDADEIVDAINETVGTSIKVSTTLKDPQSLQRELATLTPPQPKPSSPGSSTGSSGAPRAKPKSTQEGSLQNNSKTVKRKAVPRRNPAVTKADENAGYVSALIDDGIRAVSEQDFDKIDAVLTEAQNLPYELAETVIRKIEQAAVDADLYETVS